MKKLYILVDAKEDENLTSSTLKGSIVTLESELIRSLIEKHSDKMSGFYSNLDYSISSLSYFPEVLKDKIIDMNRKNVVIGGLKIAYNESLQKLRDIKKFLEESFKEVEKDDSFFKTFEVISTYTNFFYIDTEKSSLSEIEEDIKNNEIERASILRLHSNKESENLNIENSNVKLVNILYSENSGLVDKITDAISFLFPNIDSKESISKEEKVSTAPIQADHNPMTEEEAAPIAPDPGEEPEFNIDPVFEEAANTAADRVIEQMRNYGHFQRIRSFGIGSNSLHTIDRFAVNSANG